jgi:hypothetical protein
MGVVHGRRPIARDKSGKSKTEGTRSGAVRAQLVGFHGSAAHAITGPKRLQPWPNPLSLTCYLCGRSRGRIAEVETSGDYLSRGTGGMIKLQGVILKAMAGWTAATFVKAAFRAHTTTALLIKGETRTTTCCQAVQRTG